MIPENYHPRQPRLGYISETLWRTADVIGKFLVLVPPCKEAFLDTTISVAYIRLVPTDREETWPKETKRLVAYFDSNFHGHFVDSVAEIKGHVMPLRDGDYPHVLWTTCREDTCYYRTGVGNLMAPYDARGPSLLGRARHEAYARPG